MKIQPKLLSLLSVVAGTVWSPMPVQAESTPEPKLVSTTGQDPKPCPTPKPTTPEDPPKPRPPIDPCIGCGRG